MQRQVSFVEAIQMAFNKYCCFTGRASRSEYWWWTLFCLLVGVVVGAIFGSGNTGITISGIVNLALILPGLGVAVRRLHDINKSGWFILLAFIPIVGAIILIVWFIRNSDPTANQYGPVPNVVA